MEQKSFPCGKVSSMWDNCYELQWTHFTHPESPGCPTFGFESIPRWKHLEMMYYPSPPEPGSSREQLGGKCISSMGVHTAGQQHSVHREVSLLCWQMQGCCHQPQIRGARDSIPITPPSWERGREDVVPLPTVWTPPASGHAEELCSTCWRLSPLSPAAVPDQWQQDANQGSSHYQGWPQPFPARDLITNSILTLLQPGATARPFQAGQ